MCNVNKQLKWYSTYYLAQASCVSDFEVECEIQQMPTYGWATWVLSLVHNVHIILPPTKSHKDPSMKDIQHAEYYLIHNPDNELCCCNCCLDLAQLVSQMERLQLNDELADRDTNLKMEKNKSHINRQIPLKIFSAIFTYCLPCPQELEYCFKYWHPIGNKVQPSTAWEYLLILVWYCLAYAKSIASTFFYPTFWSVQGEGIPPGWYCLRLVGLIQNSSPVTNTIHSNEWGWFLLQG